MTYVSPNPSLDKATVHTDFDVEYVSIVSAEGLEVLRETNLSDSKEIEINVLEEGIYFITVGNSNESKVMKWIKK